MQVSNDNAASWSEMKHRPAARSHVINPIR
jgi:tyrosine aminotransferase